MSIFDGKAFAREIEAEVAARVAKMAIKPKIVSVLVGDDPASVLYTRLKKEAAERVGIEFEVIRIGEQLTANGLRQKIAEIGEREDVTGVMVQLPIVGLQGLSLQEVLSAIPLKKDVDGLRWEESGVMPATVRGVMSILEEIAGSQGSELSFTSLQTARSSEPSELWEQRFVVLGARGAVGRPLVYFLKQRGVEVSEVEWDTPEPARRLLEGQVVISCVGKAGLITGEMVQKGVIAIDVGMSRAQQRISESANQPRIVGDMTKEVYDKSEVAVPVPGGVGPVTVACLMKNGEELSDARHRSTGI